MTSTITRRDAIKITAGLVIGTGLIDGMPPVEAAIAVPRRDMAALTAWEDALADASLRGEAWVKDMKQMHLCVQLAVWQAEEMGEGALLQSLRPVLAEAEAVHAARSATFQRWADEAWNLPDLAPLPAEPWG
ncbi:MAG: hypothetical protein M3R02_14525 [Chloroflexota bacterium]|nr:hypothetical protein [Chloroflexota bacterium]